jgi:trehalose-phosphatase
MSGAPGIATVVGRIAHRLDGSPLALFLDIDGTLSPIAPSPEAAVVPEETRDILRGFLGMRDVSVAVVTGRSAADALRMVDLEGIWIVGNHGMELRTPAGELTSSKAARPYAHTVREAADRLANVVRPVAGAALENKTWSVSVHYRLAARAAVPTLVAMTEGVASEFGLRVVHGKEIVELRPPIAVNKGTTSLELAERLAALADDASLLYAGDDRTDEDAFTALRARKPEAVTIRVGAPADVEETSAELTVASPEHFRELLEWLRARRTRARVTR